MTKCYHQAPRPPETARLDDYIRKAWTKDPSVQLFNTEDRGGADDIEPPTLRRDRKNRIIYYIGSFNPPHAGHVALLDHIYHHSRDPSGFNAVAVLVMAHGQSWVRRKVRNDSQPVHLKFEQRRRLLEDGLGAERRRWLWVLPRDVNAWWVFQTKLNDACARDGFALEFHELLGPDYVKAERPQCHGWHGVVTSNICRPADFDAGNGQPLRQMVEFEPWVKERRQLKEQEEGQQQQAVEEGTRATEDDSDDNEVWMCHKQVQGQDYSIRYIRTKHPTLDPDMSSTKLREHHRGLAA
ncbi:uncharacterized protein PG986_008672 [Apiospora aurea]|uniref:Cytidyltransferase-like domain-containing protein n=1 Tax=Apiospora aurea TaxID=335848 RepID=A0ABR1Q6T2_9PEZI